MRSLLFLLPLLALVAQAERVTYEGYQVLKLSPTTESGLAYLRQLEQESQVLFGSSIQRSMAPVYVAVPPHMLTTSVQKSMFKNNIGVQLIHPNLAEIVEAERQRLSAKPRAFDIDDFNTLADIYSELDAWESRCPSGLTCETSDFGFSYENQPIPVVKFSSGAGRTAVWVDATHHAREWLATATILKLMDHVYANYGSDPDTTRMVDTYDWYFAPMINPDGYEYTWTNDRYWRRNRNNEYPCVGVDLNRNYDHFWGEEGVSHTPCSETYCGPSAASEPETQEVQEEIASIADANGVISVVTIHSYGRMWMFPPGNTVDFAGRECERADDHDDMMAVADAAADAIQASGGQSWARGTSCEVIYATTGATDDWSKFQANVKYSFNPELRGNGFVVSAAEIQPSYEEIWAGLVAMVDEIVRIEGRH